MPDHAPHKLMLVIGVDETDAKDMLGVAKRSTRREGERRIGDLIPDAGYVAGVRVLRAARAWCVRRRTPGALCEVAAYCSGPAGVRGRWYRMPRAILRRRDALRRVMGSRPARVPADRSGA